MALVAFRSRAAAEIFMFAETAQRIFDILGRAPSSQGVITSDQLSEAITRLSQAVEQEKAQAKNSANDAETEDGAQVQTAQNISLAQRAFPLLEMLRAAEKRKVEVTWGV